MEVLDKIDSPSFGLQDMELLGLFARQAALAISQGQQYDRLGEALVLGLRSLVLENQAETLTSLDETIVALDDAGELFKLANTFNEISQLGESEQKACLRILQVFADYRRSKPGYY
jgi:GAF domain-containing protein